MKKILLTFLFVVLLVSCSTLEKDVTKPSWVDNPPFSILSTVIVGKGAGESEEAADEAAYLCILSTLSEKAGVDYTEKYYEELSLTDRISAFDTTVTTKYRTFLDGVYYTYLLSTTDTVRLQEVSAADYNFIAEREQKVKDKVSESLSYYKENRDVDAVGSLLEAVELSLEYEMTDDDYKTPHLVERLEKYVSQIKFEFIGRTSETEGEIGFRIYRAQGIMYPSVEKAGVKIIYPSITRGGDVIYLPLSAMSDENGIVKVNKTNAYSLKNGTMSIVIDVDEDIIKRIDEKAGDALLASFKALLEENVLSSAYSEEETYDSGEAVIAVALFGYDGSRIDITDALSTILDMADTLGLSSVSVVEAEGEEEEETLSYLKERYSSTAVIYMVRVGIVDRVHTLGTWYTKTEGKIIKIDNRNSTTEEYKTMQCSTASSGDAPDDTEALRNQIRLTVSFVLGEF